MISLGFRSSISDTSLIIMRHGLDYLFVLIYVDKIIATGSSSLLVSDFIATLTLDFSVKDLSPLHYFLRIKIYQHSSSLFLSQSKYTTNLLQKTNMHNSTSISIPMSSSEKPTLLDGLPLNTLSCIIV